MKQIIKTIFIFIGLCMLWGCSEEKEKKNTTDGSMEPQGVLHFGYFYQEEGIVASSWERFMYSDWDTLDFEYICTDLTCDHMQEECSARMDVDADEEKDVFGLYYGDKFIIVESHRESADENKDGVDIETIKWTTDVYEAEKDGSNREKVATFPGKIGTSDTSYAAVLLDGKLYFGGPTKMVTEIRFDEETGEPEFKYNYDDAFFCVDLEDYSVKTYGEEKGKADPSYSYAVRVFDGYVYAAARNSDEGAWWYRIDPEADRCREIVRLDERAPWFRGAIGNRIYYCPDDNVLCSMDVEEAREEELVSLPEGQGASALVLDGRLLVRTNRSLEEDDYSVEYTVYDAEGNPGEVYSFDDYFVFLDVLGDRIIMLKPYASEMTWWNEKGDLGTLLEDDKCIGGYLAGSHDKLCPSVKNPME